MLGEVLTIQAAFKGKEKEIQEKIKGVEVGWEKQTFSAFSLFLRSFRPSVSEEILIAMLGLSLGPQR